MTFFGGISFLVHFIILLVKWITKHPKSAITTLLVMVVVTFGAFFSIKHGIKNSPNITILQNTFYSCENTAMASNNHKNTIIVRLDDIQAFAWRDTSMKMINYIIDKDLKVTLGVIPKNLKEDAVLVKFLRKTSCNTEIAQHGWDHGQSNGNTKPEFANITKSKAYNRIIRGKRYLEEIFNKSVVSFIPPNNVYSEEVLEALRQANVSFMSSEFTTTTVDYGTDSEKLKPVKDIVDSCKQGLRTNNLCIVLVHPQDYTTDDMLDESKYAKFTNLINQLSVIDADFMTIEEYARYKKTEYGAQ